MPEPITLLSAGAGIFGLGIHLARTYFEVAKELADIVLGAIILVLVSPLMAFCALLIKLSSKGPVFYWQTRLGRDGKPFRMCKLRTMRPDSETSSGAVWARAEILA